MRKTWWMLVATALAGATLSSQARADDNARARKILEEAFNHRYHWNDNFKGFSADFALTYDGKLVKGSVKADVTKPHGGVVVECGLANVKTLVSEVVGSTVTHTRGSTFVKSFGSSAFTIASKALHGGTKIASTGHGFFKDFTVKDGNIVENHGGHGEMSTEVKVEQVVWLANSGQTCLAPYSSTIKHGDTEQSGKNLESWSEIDGIWLPTWWRLSRNEGVAPWPKARLSWKTSRSNRRVDDESDHDN